MESISNLGRSAVLVEVIDPESTIAPQGLSTPLKYTSTPYKVFLIYGNIIRGYKLAYVSFKKHLLIIEMTCIYIK